MFSQAIGVATILCVAVLSQGTAAQTNFALGKPATQSSTYSSSGVAHASRAVDGNTATDWASASCTATKDSYSKDFEPWLRVDLESAQTLATVKLWNRGDCCPERLHGISIYVGNDATAFGNNPTCATNIDVPQTDSGYEFPCVATGRYVWVAMPGKTETLTMCELQALGPVTPEPPTPPPTLTPPTPVPPPTPLPTPEPPTPAPTPIPDICHWACLKQRCVEGETLTIRMRGHTGGFLPVYGDGHYAEDSDMGLAAVHAGVLSVGEEKNLQVTCAGYRESFPSTTKNGITSTAYDRPYGSFFFVDDSSVDAPPTSPPAPVVCYHQKCLLNSCLIAGQKIDLVLTGTNFGFSWGNPRAYTLNSAVAYAAVHAGVVQNGETATVRINCLGWVPAFIGGFANGVLSYAG